MNRPALPASVLKWLRPGFLPRPALNVWQWAEANVDFALATNYDTPIKGRYDANFMPYWKEPVECLTRYDVNEVVVLKCARAGGSENLLLNAIRYAVAMRPQPTLYVTGDQLSAERMMEKRIKRSMRCAKATAREYRHGSGTQHDIAFPSMDFRVTWPKAKQAFKQDGWALILCDEVSTWPDFSADMARKRTASYPFPHIVFISSPDPQAKRGSDDDPIFVEYRRGDCRKWTCRDGNGADFVFEMGHPDTAYGLKWDASARGEDGKWDFDRVRETAHYVTPSGCIIREPQRMGLVRGGRWVATQSAPSNVRSYHVSAFMTPFDSFGGIAVAFLKANASGPQALRTFVYEYLAEPWYGEKQTIDANEIENRRGSYRAGTRLVESPAYGYLSARRSTVIQTVDVQKDRMYCVVREWFEGGDSALVDFQETTAWKDVAALRAKHNCERVFVDLGYAGRRNEVLEQCMYGEIKGAVPMFGRDSLKEAHKVQRDYDPFEGTAKQGRVKMPVVTFNPDQVKHILARLMAGLDPRQWLLPANVTAEYIRQITAEECIDGAWVAKHKDNHATDCETMNLVAAMILGKFSEVVPDLAAITAAPKADPPRPARVRGVYVPD